MELPVLYKRSGDRTVMWRTWVTQNKAGAGVIHTEYGQVGGKLQHIQETISVGKNAGRANATTPLAQAEKEATASWRKQQERGQYGTDPEACESAEKRAAAPMLAQQYEKHAKKVDWSTAYAQPKLDGNRCLARMDASKQVTLWTRKGVQITTLEHLVEPLQTVMRPGETFDGEVYVHGMHVTNLRSLLTRKQDGCEQVSYRIYDLLSPAPFRERLGELEDRDLADEEPQDGLMLVRTLRIPNDKQLMAFQRECIASGFEGAMLRWGPAGYEAGKRSDSLLKVKTFQDLEFPVMNIREGRGTHAGMAILVCETKGGFRFDVTAPGTHEEKREVWTNRKNYLGRMVQVKFQNYTNTEAPVPFQPVAVRFRDEED